MDDIQVIRIDPKTRRVTLKLSHNTVTGIMKLAQLVVLSLLNVPGKSVLNPSLGGGVPELVGMNFDPNDATEVFGEVAIRVRKVQTELLKDQIGKSIPGTEKLKDIRILSIDSGASEDEVLVRLRIINEAGQTLDIVM